MGSIVNEIGTAGSVEDGRLECQKSGSVARAAVRQPRAAPRRDEAFVRRDERRSRS